MFQILNSSLFSVGKESGGESTLEGPKKELFLILYLTNFTNSFVSLFFSHDDGDISSL